MNFKEWLTSRGFDYDKLSESQRTAMQVDFDVEQERAAAEEQKTKQPVKDPDGSQRTQPDAPAAVPPAVSTDSARAATDAVAAERQRCSDIRALAGDDVPDDVILRCIDGGKTVDEARTEILTAVRANRPAVGSSPAGIISSGEINRELIEDAMVMRGGHEDIILADKKNGEQRADKADKIRDLALLDICRHAIQMDGKNVPVGRDDIIRAAFSTSTLTVILGNVAKKSMMKGYNSVLETWRNWCSIGTTSDFKTMTRARLTDTGDLEEVGSGGSVGYGGVEEEYEQYNIATYAKNFGITRTQIINDDLHALTKEPMRMGLAAKRKVGDLVYAHLMANGNMQDGTALFHADHSNLRTGSALTQANIKAAITAFSKQTDKAGKAINIPVAALIVPPDLMFTAAELLKSAMLIITGSTDSVQGSRNVLADLNVEVVSEQRLSNSGFTGNSTTSWYLAGDKNQADTIEVSYLNGRQAPTLEKLEMTADRLGVIFRVLLDVGCKSLDHRGMQKNNA